MEPHAACTNTHLSPTVMFQYIYSFKSFFVAFSRITALKQHVCEGRKQDCSVFFVSAAVGAESVVFRAAASLSLLSVLESVSV